MYNGEFKGDVVQTSANSALGVIFSDGTAFNLAANARMVLTDFVYDAKSSNNSALISQIEADECDDLTISIDSIGNSTIHLSSYPFEETSRCSTQS